MRQASLSSDFLLRSTIVHTMKVYGTLADLNILLTCINRLTCVIKQASKLLNLTQETFPLSLSDFHTQFPGILIRKAYWMTHFSPA